MEEYKKRLALILAETGALFFEKNLVLKDGRPTPYFVNLGMFRTGRLSREMGSFFADMIVHQGLSEGMDVILGPSYKGSAIALATAIALYGSYGRDVSFEYDRKEAKIHGEASQGGNLFVNRTFFDGCRIFIVDDVATSMATKMELIQKVEEEAKARKIHLKIIGVGIAVNREQTTAVYSQDGHVILGRKGKNAIEDFVSATAVPVYSVAGIREIVRFLHKEQVPVLVDKERMALDDKTMLIFDEYLRTYGTE